MRRAFVAATICALLVGCSTPARLTMDERPWIELETENVAIWTSVGEARARRLIQRMELFRSVAEFVVGRKLPKPLLPIRMIVFSDMKA
jgi:hypothetical protein